MNPFKAIGHWRRANRVLEAWDAIRQGHEPARISALVVALCMLLAGFGALDLTAEQMSTLGAAGAILAGEVIRRRVTPDAKGKSPAPPPPEPARTSKAG